MQIHISNSVEDTKAFAKDFAKELKKGDVVCLNGDLGAGKTALVKAIADELGVGAYVTSPTFTIVNEYITNNTKMYHFDVYRIDNPDEMYEIGYEEYVYSDAISIIEWADNIKEILPDKRYDLYIEKDILKGEDYRLIKVKKRGVD